MVTKFVGVTINKQQKDDREKAGKGTHISPFELEQGEWLDGHPDVFHSGQYAAQLVNHRDEGVNCRFEKWWVARARRCAHGRRLMLLQWMN